MSYSTALGVIPNRRPIKLAELRNAWGWSPSIWGRLGVDIGDNPGLDRLWRQIESLPPWQQTPLVLTFDTGVIPAPAFAAAAEELDEFDRRLPAPEGQANHVPAVADLLRSLPEVPLFGMWGTSVTDNPFDPWDEAADDYGSGIPLAEMYLLGRHRPLLPPPPLP